MKHNLLIVSIVMVAMSLSYSRTHTVGFAEFDPHRAGGYCNLSYEIKADPEADQKDACYQEWKKCSTDETTCWSEDVCGSPCKKEYYQCKEKENGSKTAKIDILSFWKD